MKTYFWLCILSVILSWAGALYFLDYQESVKYETFKVNINSDRYELIMIYQGESDVIESNLDYDRCSRYAEILTHLSDGMLSFVCETPT